MLNYQSVPQNKSANSPHHPPRLRRDASTALPRAIARGGRDAAGAAAAAAVAGLGGVAGGLALRVATCGSMGSFTNGHPPQKKNRKSPWIIILLIINHH